MKRGDFVEFKRSGPVATVLGGLLKLFERDWDGWGWHLAILWEKRSEGWMILESVKNGVSLNYYPNKDLERTRIWLWFEELPTREVMEIFYKDHIGKRYDAAIYFWTVLQYIIRHYFNHRIPRLLDDRFTCWELVFWFARCMGKPIQSVYDCPIITDFLKVMEVGISPPGSDSAN